MSLSVLRLMNLCVTSGGGLEITILEPTERACLIHWFIRLFNDDSQYAIRIWLWWECCLFPFLSISREFTLQLPTYIHSRRDLKVMNPFAVFYFLQRLRWHRSNNNLLIDNKIIHSRDLCLYNKRIFEL